MDHNLNEKPIEIDIKEYEKIKAERDFYKNILDKIPAVIHVNNLQTELVEWVNDAAEKFSGYTKEQMINNPEFLNNVVVEQDLDWIQESIKDYKQLKGVYSNIYSMKHYDSSIHTYHGLGVVFETDENNRPVKNLAIDLDITHEVRNYKQLKKHLEELTRKLRKSELEGITKMELKVIELLCQGKTIKQIACELERSVHTIDNHKRNIYRKLKLHKNQELILWAKEVGLV